MDWPLHPHLNPSVRSMPGSDPVTPGPPVLAETRGELPTEDPYPQKEPSLAYTGTADLNFGWKIIHGL